MSLRRTRHLFVLLAAVAIVAAGSTQSPSLDAQEQPSRTADVTIASWIWYAEGRANESAPAGTRYFRQTFEMDFRPITKAILDITCDDRYEVFVNGDLVGSGTGWQRVRHYDITRRTQNGENVLAIKATNDSGPAGLLVRCLVDQRGGTQVSASSDGTWRAFDREVTGWNTLNFNARDWPFAREIGPYGRAEPWGELVWEAGSVERFQVPEGFHVEPVATANMTGSLVCMTFDEQGRILASREEGPILLLKDTDGDGAADTPAVFSDQVTHCQGLFVVDGQLYAAGNGPEQAGLYRLTDTDGDDVADRVETIGKIQGEMMEHGPHALVLGPDGWLYWSLGNFAHIAADPEPDSPSNSTYEGDILHPRYEDPRGHSYGIKAPGGTIIRVDRDGKRWHRFAAGFRNQYDIAFSAAGELFTFDSDMEWDQGLPWYRPVRVCHIVPGAEFGWRSGFAKWPTYFFDSLPAAVDLSRGSPTGVVFYHHNQFPATYDDTLFIGDWSQGRILAVHLQRDGATWKGTSEVFATGQPLNVTDIEVGPDGSLYFSCGGRGTQGGIFRIVYSNKDRQAPVPSLSRTHALNLLQQFASPPSQELLQQLTQDENPLIRAHAVYLLGLNAHESGRDAIIDTLKDLDPLVRRRACEALVRGGVQAEPSDLLPLLADEDRFVRYAARRAVQAVPFEKWIDEVLSTDNARIATAGMLALLVPHQKGPTLQRIIDRQAQLLNRPLADDDLLDLLRTLELSLSQADLGRKGTVPEIRERLLEQFPGSDWRVQREQARILAFLKEARAVPKLLDRLAEEPRRVEQVHLAFCARFIREGWDRDRKWQFLQWLETTRSWDKGWGFPAYIENLTRDVVPLLHAEEQSDLLARGEAMPFVTRLLAESLEAAEAQIQAPNLIELDTRVRRLTERSAQSTNERTRRRGENPAEAREKLRRESLAVLGRAGTPKALGYLRQQFDAEPDLRGVIARALAGHPVPENWDCLVRSLDFATGQTLQDCLQALKQIDRQPDDPQVTRSVIIAGLKLGPKAGQPAAELLAHWFDNELAEPDDPGALAHWQEWFAKSYPDLPPATLPKTQTPSRWTFDQLLTFLEESPGGRQGSPERGAAVFEKARCLQCHRFGPRGETIGPDLTTVRLRFQRQEILESIFYPSQVISDQYRSHAITTIEGQVKVGLIAPHGPDAIVVLDSEGEKTVIPKSKIEEQQPSNTSAMPEGLLNMLTLEEIANLFAFLEQSAEQTVQAPASADALPSPQQQ